MTKDRTLVERLRSTTVDTSREAHQLLDEAADEIERLLVAMDTIRELYSDEIKRLQLGPADEICPRCGAYIMNEPPKP